VFTLFLVALETGCAWGRSKPLTIVDAAAATAPPSTVVSLIESTWPDAKVTDAGTGPACPSAPADPAAPVLAGDFNGDGTADVAVRVQRADGLHLATGMHQTYAYVVVDVGLLADPSSGIAVRPKGATYMVPDTAIDSYFGADTLVVTPCGKPPTAYLWNGSAFTPQVISK
jgi:hypothetical protein